MSTIFHLGDSYGYTDNKEPHFVEVLSRKIGYTYDCESTILPGGSNEQLFHWMLRKLYSFTTNDILFFNFSYFVRGCYYDKKNDEIRSTNRFYLDGLGVNGKIMTNERHIFDIVTHLIDYSEDYNRRLFYQFDLVFEQLEKKGIGIYFIFNENTSWSDKLLKHGNHIKFESGFNQWLVDSGYNNHECCHFTKGVQEEILNHIISKGVLKDILI